MSEMTAPQFLWFQIFLDWKALRKIEEEVVLLI